jgi:hypothetical protein
VTRRLIPAVCIAACSGIAHAEPVALADDLHLPPPGAAPSDTEARGRHGDRLRAVVNFAGGWTGQRYGDRNSPGYADAGGRSRLPMLWLYAEGDSYYSPFAIRGHFEAFEKAGGNGRLVLFGGLPGNGHRLVDFVPVGKPNADRFLASLGF